MDVIAERLQRRNINDASFVAECAGKTFTEQSVQFGEESGEGFSRAGGCGDQGMAAGLDRGPAAFLGFGGRAELLLEPARDRGMKLERIHNAIVYTGSERAAGKNAGVLSYNENFRMFQFLAGSISLFLFHPDGFFRDTRQP